MGRCRDRAHWLVISAVLGLAACSDSPASPLAAIKSPAAERSKASDSLAPMAPAVPIETQTVEAQSSVATPSNGPDRKTDVGLAILEQLKKAFEAGFQVGPRSATEAQDLLTRVRRLAPHEPRIDYSHGLVLVRQSQMKLAIVQFEAAVSQEGPPFWPAWKASIWSHLVEKRYEPGLNRLVEFAGLVRDAGGPGGPPARRLEDDESQIAEVQRDAARWIGQLLEALAQLPDSKKHRNLIDERQSRVLDALGDELSFSVHEGRELLLGRALELGLAADAARDTAAQIARRRKLDKDQDGIVKAKGNAPLTKEEFRVWIDGILAQCDRQRHRMDREFQNLAQRANELERSYAQAEARLAAAATTTGIAHETAGSIGVGMLLEQLAACHDQMRADQVEYHMVVEQMMNIAQRASKIADDRAGAIVRYEQETGDAIPKNPDFDKWAKQVNVKRPKSTARSAVKPARTDAVGKRPPPTLKSLMPLDLERERDGVLTSFGLDQQ